jgi:hypothetical protein
MCEEARNSQPSIWAAEAFLSLLLALVCSACVQSQYRFKLTDDFPGNALGSPNVGVAVLVDALPSAAKESDAIISAFEGAIADELRQRGYAPTLVHSEVLKDSITDSLGYPTHGKIQQHRPLVENKVIGQAAARGLSGVFVVWVSISRAVPTQQFMVGNTMTTYRGDQPILWGTAMVEIFSTQGEGLRFFGGDVHGLQKGNPSDPLSSYRVQSPEEAAAASMKSAFSQPRMVLPYAASK